MDKRITLSVVGGLSILGLGIALFYAQPKNQNASPPAGHNEHPSSEMSKRKFSADETAYDFGTVSMKNGLVTKEFTVTNNENEPLSLRRLYTSCMCTKAYLEINGAEKGPFGMLGHGVVPGVNETLPASGQAKIKAVFDPNAHGPAGVGPIEREVTLEDEQGILISFNIKANVVP